MKEVTKDTHNCFELAQDQRFGGGVIVVVIAN